jgi:DNA processing protein
MMSDYGGLVAERIAFDLASLGITIVSGMARGIDTASHKGALSAGGRSIAVLGCGIDRPYPSENARLLKSLTHSGCVISEFPMGTPPNKEHFPRRNRLISGLSSGVLVVEAAVESGSLITAQYALEQGKEVFAVPGNITSKTSEGTNALIQSGAKLVQRVEDILEELPHHFRERLALSGKTAHDVRDRMSHGLAFSDEEKAICTVLSSDPKHIDSLVRETNIPAARLLGILLSLEMKGIVRQAEGKRFHLR